MGIGADPVPEDQSLSAGIVSCLRTGGVSRLNVAVSLFCTSAGIDSPRLAVKLLESPLSPPGQAPLIFGIDAERCVACLACVCVPHRRDRGGGGRACSCRSWTRPVSAAASAYRLVPWRGQGKWRDRQGSRHRLAGRRDPDPESGVGRALLSGHTRAADQRVLRRRLPGRHPGRDRRRTRCRGIP